MTPTDLQLRLEQALTGVRDQAGLLTLLRDVLDWPLPQETAPLEALSYEWPLADLRAEGLSDKLAQSVVYQLQLAQEQPWGIFVIEFASDQPFHRDRGLSGPLRRLLAGLVASKQRDPQLPAWKREQLLFICTYRYQHFRIGWFRQPQDSQRQPVLAAFGWGPDIPARTACEHNLDKLQWPADATDTGAWVEAWSRAFSVEKVTDRFFREYVELFGRNELSLGRATKYRDARRRLYTQVLMNRLFFLRFVERKGWLKLGPDASYLASLWDAYLADPTPRKNFYRDRLRPLFFEGLALDDPQRKAELVPLLGEVPFINGGLFDHHRHAGKDLDAGVETLPDDIFASLLDRKDGLFYRYNFTVAESTPLSVEVAVDPEILGRVFEELITGRHETGSYYTPRPIVSFMCREALKGYLASRTSVPADALERLVDDHDDSGLTDRLAQVPALVDALSALRAVDPACGSGAYLLGLLHELLDLYRLLYQASGEVGESTYRLKLQIISQSLYGVDLDPVATNIAMLRLWLSLAVEAPRPLALPNLDFKIETGNAVLGPNPAQTESVLLHGLARDLALKKKRYLTAHGGEKEALGADIQAQEQVLASQIEGLYGQGVVDWRVQFAEVLLSDAGGFDIVLANPPYERQELLVEIKPQLRAVYGPLYRGTADLLVYFYYRALELLRPGGMLAFISSNKWLKAGYGDKLREHLHQEAHVWSLTDFGDLPVFAKAIAYPVIVIAEKGGTGVRTRHTTVPSLAPPYPDIKALQREHGTTLTADSFQGSVWTLAGGDDFKRLRKMEESGIPLGEYVQGQIYRGVLTGLNEAFVINGARRAELIAQDPRSAELIKPLIRGRDIKRWHAAHQDQWLIFTRRGTRIQDYPAIRKHLKHWKAELTPLTRDQSETNRGLGVSERVPGRKPGTYKWYEIQDEVAYYEAFERPKIVFTDIAPSSQFARAEPNTYVLNTAYVLPDADNYLLAILNSQSVLAWYADASNTVRGGFLRFIRQYVARIPIPVPNSNAKKELAALARKCLDAKGVGCEAWEAEINERVAALYGL